MSIEKLLEVESTFLLFTAPPAWGKTRMLFDIIKKSKKKIIYLSPLKALSLEFFQAVKKEFKAYGIGSSDFKLDTKVFLNSDRGILIVTPELISSELIFEIGREKNRYIVVIDEVHLFFYWGKTFRPHLLEVLWGIMSQEISLLALSATISDEIQICLNEGVSLNYKYGYYLNVANRELLYTPTKSFFYGYLGEKFLNRRFLSIVKSSKGCVIYFVKYRQDVDRWLDLCSRLSINAIGCVGGDVDRFICDLKDRGNNLVCIFSTTVLSHGVNLPEISDVFIGYKVLDQDFLLQMVGRGGRRGGKFSIYLMDSYSFAFFDRCYSTLVCIISDLWYIFGKF
jgi:superfamily II DNA or RNA helicase